MRNFADKNIAVCFLHPALGFLTTGDPQTVDELTIEFQMKTIYEMLICAPHQPLISVSLLDPHQWPVEKR